MLTNLFEISRLYVKDGKVLKNRYKSCEETTEEDITRMCESKDRVAIYNDSNIQVYFNTEDTERFGGIINEVQ